jgi:hypothetical protein
MLFDVSCCLFAAAALAPQEAAKTSHGVVTPCESTMDNTFAVAIGLLTPLGVARC